MTTRVTLLAGGVGGAKMAEGFAALDDVDLSIIGNVADDDSFHGLWVSPDIDTLTYTLAGLINRAQGWGVSDEATRALSVLKTLGAETWMTLGDRDFGLHIYRTQRRLNGDRPSDIARDVAQRFGVAARLLLPTDDIVQTRVRTPQGWQSFQEYFVRDKCAPEVLELDYAGLAQARATPEALAALAEAELIIIAPSNPLVSIAPILGVPGLRDALTSAVAPILAVSPLIGGQVVKGPADRMMKSLGMRADAAGIAQVYDFATGLFIDRQDADLRPEIEALGPSVFLDDILMTSAADKAALARRILGAGRTLAEERAA